MLIRMVQNFYRRKAYLYALVGVDLLFVAVFAFAYSHILPWLHHEPAFRFNLIREGAAFDAPVTDYLHCLYFSVVTQMTVGFGDIIPASDPARFVVSLQAAFGYFYLTVLVAALVGRVFWRKNSAAIPEFPQSN